MDPVATLGNGSGPSCLPQTLHHPEEEKTILNKQKRKCTEVVLLLPKFEAPSLKIYFSVKADTFVINSTTWRISSTKRGIQVA